MQGVYQKVRYAINTVTWTPIAPPLNCNYFGMKNLDSADVLLRTDMNDSGTEDLLRVGMQEGVEVTMKATQPGWYRFPIGQPVLWAKAVTGTGPIIATWVI